MAKQEKTATREVRDEAPDVRSAEESQLAVRDAGAPEDTDDAVTVAAMAGNQAFESFTQWLVERADTTDDDQYAIMASIMADIMNSANPEEVLREQSTMRAADVVGQPLLLHGFEIRAGEYEDSLMQHYAALTVSRPGAESTRVLTVGATKVLMKLYALDQFGEWPQLIMFTSKVGKKGAILDIVRP